MSVFFSLFHFFERHCLYKTMWKCHLFHSWLHKGPEWQLVWISSLSWQEVCAYLSKSKIERMFGNSKLSYFYWVCWCEEVSLTLVLSQAKYAKHHYCSFKLLIKWRKHETTHHIYTSHLIIHNIKIRKEYSYIVIILVLGIYTWFTATYMLLCQRQCTCICTTP